MRNTKAANPTRATMSSLTVEQIDTADPSALAEALRRVCETTSHILVPAAALLGVLEECEWSKPKCWHCSFHPGCLSLELEPDKVCPNPRDKDAAPCEKFDNFHFMSAPPCPTCGEFMEWEFAEEGDGDGGWICETKGCPVHDGCDWLSDNEVNKWNYRKVRAAARAWVAAGGELEVADE